MRESKIEQKVCEYAESLDWIVYKFSSPGNRGVTDRIFLRQGRIVFIEFKATGKKPSLLQERVMNRIAKAGFTVKVIDSIQDGYDLFDFLN